MINVLYTYLFLPCPYPISFLFLPTITASLQQQLESFGAYNDTLVKEKMDLSSDVMKLNEQLQKFTTTGYKVYISYPV